MNMRQADDIITGVWAIFLRKKNALNYFTIDFSNFVWSFAIIVMVVIFQTYMAPIEMQILGISPTATGEVVRINTLFQTIILSVNWFLWPIVSFVICKLMNLLPNYMRYVTIDNYSSIVTLTIIVIPSVLYQFGLPVDFTKTLIFFSSFIMLIFKWRVIKTSLDTTGVNASILLFVDFSVTIIVSYSIKQLFLS